MTYDEMIAVIAAKRDGKRVESQWLVKIGGDWKWDEMKDDAFNFGIFRYRIAPEPLTVFIPLFTNGCFGYPMESLEGLKSSLGAVGPGVIEILEFKQVIK